MSATLRHAPERAPHLVGGEDPRATETDHESLRDAIAGRCQRLEARYPKAVNLYARVLGAMRPFLSGSASALAGLDAPEHFREKLRGERSTSLADLCRLATEPTREAGDAADAAIAVLARARGSRVVSDGRAFLSETLVGAVLAEHAGVTLGLLLRALEDGRLDEREKAELLPAAVRLQQHAADLVAACRGGRA